MNIISWLSIAFLKSNSINTFFLIFILFFVLILEFFCLINLKGESFELKGFLPPRHNDKKKISHLGGMIFIPLVLMIFCTIKINSIIKFLLFHKKHLKEIALSLWNVNNNLKQNYWSFNHYISTVGLIIFTKINCLSLYFNYKNQWNIYSKLLIISSIFTLLFFIIIIVNILMGGGITLFPINGILFFNGYNILLYTGWSFLLLIIQGIISLIIIWTSVKKKISAKFHLYLSILINGFLWFVFNGLMFYKLSLNFYYIVDIFQETLLLVAFPMVLGFIDDVEKIDKTIVRCNYFLKFLIFNGFGALYDKFNGTLYHTLLKYISTKFYPLMGSLFMIFFRGLLFNTWVNGINFTDGADGLLYTNMMPALITSIPLYLFFNIGKYQGKIWGKSVMFLTSELLVEMNFIYFIMIFMMAFSVFFYFNKRPAQVMMGETGSFGVAAISFYIMSKMGFDLFFFISMIMVFFQVISTTIQTISYKIRKKRLFLMAPFHHHLELLNYSDDFILKLYLLINIIGLCIGLLIYFYWDPKELNNIVLNFVKKII